MIDQRDRRTVDFLGPEAFALLRRCRVTVVGVGGVGSHTATALARAGVAALRLVDPDLVSWSSLNRHACATPDDVGLPKAEVTAAFLRRLRPELAVRTALELVTGDRPASALVGSPDMVVDAIDGVSAKTALLARCLQDGVPVVSSMGASSRSDPSLVRVGELWQSRGCPLARVIRRRLRLLLPGRPPIPVVYSVETPRPPLDADAESAASPGTPRRQPSLPTLPGIFGYALANLVILELSASRRT